LARTDYTKQQLRAARLAKAMAHPARIAIIQFLANQNACVCGDIVESLPLAQASVSQHLKKLKLAGLIHGEVEGTSVCYCLDPKAWAEAQDAFADLFSDVSDRARACCG
jgi:DNA-binding transcriptional ArsR family regulator